MLHFHIILAFAILAITLIAIHNSPAEGKPVPGDPEAVEEVMSGKRKEAKVSWWGFDPEDATTAMQSAINSGAEKLIIEDMGAPWIVDKIQLASDQEILFEKGVAVIAKRGAFKGRGDSLFTASLKSNITLNGYGATLKMRKSDYMGEGYEKAEWRHALSIRSCSNIRVYGLTLEESGGDGIYLGVAKSGVTNTDIHIKDVICDSNYRQGISVISARNLLIENCILKNTSGTPPSAGIDFEPNHASEELVNCVMRNCVSENNDGDGYEFYIRNLNGKSADLSIRLENCRSIGDRMSVRYVIDNGPGDAAVKGLTEFVNCSFENGRNGGVLIGDKPADAGRIRFVECVISNPALDNARVSPIVFNTRHGATEDIGGADFVDCIIRDPVDRIPVDFKDWSGDLRVTDVTGLLMIQRDGTKKEYQITPELLKDWIPILSFKKIPKLSLSGAELQPVFPDADPDSFGKCFARLRRSAKCILYAKENERVQLNIRYFQVGRYSGRPMPVKVYSTSGELIHEQDIAFKSEAEVTFAAPQTGIYSVAFSTGHNAVQITRSSHRLCISSEDAPSHFFGTTGELYFYVPNSTREFGVKVFGDSSSEAVKATLIGPSGEDIETKDNITQPHVFIVSRDDADPGEVWKLKIEKPSAIGFEDYYIQLLGIPPLISCSKEALLMGENDRVSFSQPGPKVEVYDYVEITINVSDPNMDNPFTDVFVEGKFQKEGDQQTTVDGFCDSMDGGIFRVRFMPTSSGKYSYSVTYRHGNSERTSDGAFEAVESGRRGVLRTDPENPWHFVWEGTGEHYFWNGTTTYYLMGWQDDETIQKAIDRLHSMKINRLRVLVYGRNKDHPWGMPIVPTENFKLWLNPWAAERPDDIENPGFDLTRFNVSFWQRYERMLRYARERDVIISVILFIGGQIYPTPFDEDSQDEWRYYRYAAARLAAFSNITWDLGNEHNFHREYPAWADKLGHKVKEWDPYDHPTSAHNKTYRTPDSTWIDMQLIQRWDSGQNAFMLSQREQQVKSGRIIPQINEEYGYQDLWEKYPGQREAETRRRCAWEIYMAGCYQTAGETARTGTGVPPDTGGGWVNGRGDDTMVMLKSYEHIVDFFTGFEWWKLEPHNELTEAPAVCLADPGNTYVIYMIHPDNATVNLESGNYHARWFNPRTGRWTDMPQANAPLWTSPKPPDEGDWVILLTRDPNPADQTPPSVSRATASGDGRKLFVTFSELVDSDTATDISNYSIDNGVSVKSAVLNEDGKTVVLEISEFAEGSKYTLTVSNIKDAADPPNVIEADSPQTFSFHSVLHPVVNLKFDENSGRTTANTGTSSKSHPTARLTRESYPSWTGNVPSAGGESALDFGAEAGEQAVDLAGGPIPELMGAKSFTITGWVNCRDATVGSGGNRIVTWINHGGDGVDLVFLKDGRLQISVNEWPDRSPAKSSVGKITVDPDFGTGNWRFFAVAYDSTADSGNVGFYFGDSSREATLDRTVNYNQGCVGYNSSPILTVGNFNPATRSRRNSDRVFRGLIDEIRVYASKNDGTGALTLNQIRQIQKGKGL